MSGISADLGVKRDRGFAGCGVDIFDMTLTLKGATRYRWAMKGMVYKGRTGRSRMRRSEKVKRGKVKLPNDEEEAARRTCLSDIPDFETFDQAESQDADGEPRKATQRAQGGC